MDEFEELVPVVYYYFPYKAELARMWLEDAGIASLVQDDYITGMNILFAPNRPPVMLLVKESDYAEAWRVISDHYKEALNKGYEDGLQHAESGNGVEKEEPMAAGKGPCPRCGSENVELARLPGCFLVLSVAMLGLPFLLIRDRWKCGECWNEWRAW
ncbi:MAG: hypothetical protein ACYS8W_10625 [Planctomycetota bacterium]|jgi:hypothetical protein